MNIIIIIIHHLCHFKCARAHLGIKVSIFLSDDSILSLLLINVYI